MIGNAEIEKMFAVHMEPVRGDDPNLTKHATLFSQFRAFANYIDVELPDGTGKDEAMAAMLESSRLSHEALGYKSASDEVLQFEETEPELVVGPDITEGVVMDEPEFDPMQTVAPPQPEEVTADGDVAEEG